MKKHTPPENKKFLKNIYQPDFSAKKQKHPAVLVLHEITGITEHTKKVAKKFANDGFIAATPDLFDNEKVQEVFQNMPNIAERAMKEGRSSAELNKEINKRLYKILNSKKYITDSLKKLNDWIYFLKSLDIVDANNISAVGFSFGGWYVFKLAQFPNKISKSVVFYGFYDVTEEMIKEIKCPLLGFYGELEKNKSEINKIQKLAKKYNNKPIEIHMCKQARHSFFDDTNLKRYNKKASDFAWKKTLKFLK